MSDKAKMGFIILVVLYFGVAMYPTMRQGVIEIYSDLSKHFSKEKQ